MNEVWIVDDIARHRADVVDVIKNVDNSAKVFEFRKAQDALNELARRESNKIPQPNIIVLDRNLQADEPPYDIGENVVRAIRTHYPSQKITIVARSSIKKCAGAMVAAGADIAIGKDDPEKLNNFLQKQLE